MMASHEQHCGPRASHQYPEKLLAQCQLHKHVMESGGLYGALRTHIIVSSLYVLFSFMSPGIWNPEL